MDSSSDENVNGNWVFINKTSDDSSNSTILTDGANKNEIEENKKKKSSFNDENHSSELESDIDSDGISVISEGSPYFEHLDETSAEEKDIEDGKPEEIDKKNKPMLNEETVQPEPDKIDEILEGTNTTSSPVGEVEELREETENVIQTVQNLNLPEPVWNFIPSMNGLLAGAIVLAIISVILGLFFSDRTANNDMPRYKKGYVLNSKELPNNMHEDDNYKELLAINYCKRKHKSEVVSIEKCLEDIQNYMKWKEENLNMKKKIKYLEEQLKLKEDMLNNKERMFFKKQKKAKKMKNKKGDDEFLKNSDNILPDKQSKVQNDMDIDYNVQSSKFLHKQIFADAKKNYNKNNMKNYEKYQNKHEDISKQPNKQKYTKNNENTKEKKYKEKKFKNFEKHGPPKNHIYKNKIIKYENSEKKNETSDGYWITKMYEARNDLRKKHNSGEWYFDRASCRKRKRDKAIWYFDRMLNRETIRYKKSIDH